MRNIVLILGVLLIFNSVVSAELESATEIGKPDQKEVEKQESGNSLIQLMIVVIIFVSLLGVFSYVEYRLRIPGKFIFVDKVEVLVSLALATIIVIAIGSLMGIEEPISIFYIILGIVTYSFFDSCFESYVNLPKFGYKNLLDMYRERKRREKAERIQL